MFGKNGASNGVNRKTLISAGILVALIGLAYLYQGPVRTWQKDLGKTKNFLSALSVDKIDKVVINGKNQTALIKQGGVWLVEGSKFKASAAAIADMTEGLGKAAKAEVEFISTNKEKKKDFKTDNQGTSVKLYSGEKELTNFIVGKLSSDYQSTYLGQQAIDSTYLLKGVNISFVFSPEDWRDRTIFAADREKINKLRLQYPDRQFILEKDAKGEWKMTKPFTLSVKKEKLDKIIASMSALSAAAIPEQNFKPTGLDKNLLIAEASGEGIKNILMVGNGNGKDQFYAKKGDSDNIYLITKEDKAELDRKIEQFK